MNRCRPEHKDTTEHEQMLNIIVKLEKERSADRNAKGWKVEGEESQGRNGKSFGKSLR